MFLGYHLIGGGVCWGGWHDWQGQLRITHAAKQNRPGANETPTDGYVRADLEIRRFISLPGNLAGEVHLNVRNLTNAKIRNSTSFLRNYASEPGQAVELAFRLDF